MLEVVATTADRDALVTVSYSFGFASPFVTIAAITKSLSSASTKKMAIDPNVVAKTLGMKHLTTVVS
jgi:cytochrome c biogenesis protein CcdA